MEAAVEPSSEATGPAASAAQTVSAAAEKKGLALFAPLRRALREAHPLIRLSYLPRFVALSVWAVTTLRIEGRDPIFWDRAWVAVGLVAPHAWFWLSLRFWNTKRAGLVAMLVDAAISGFPVALYYSSHTLVVIAAFVVTTNAISVGGLPFLVTNLAVLVASTAAVWWGVASHYPPGRIGVVGDAFETLGLAVYMCLSAFSMRSQARRINSMRRELARANDLLEARVEERTATLAATNGAIRRFVPREFLFALGHEDVSTARLGDAAARDLTVLFADIRDFTSMSERLSAEETFAFLNGCLSKLGPHVRAHGGFVDKYIGDAIMALFPRSPADAVRAAIAMQEELRRANAANPSAPPVVVGVGVHVGHVMMGTIGETERFEATVISDAVNLTARLESLTKQLGCAVLVSEDVYAALDADLRSHARSLGPFVVKGKSKPVVLFEVFASEEPELREVKARNREPFARVLAAVERGDHAAARAMAIDLQRACPHDRPLAWWAARLAAEGEGLGDALVRLEAK